MKIEGYSAVSHYNEPHEFFVRVSRQEMQSLIGADTGKLRTGDTVDICGRATRVFHVEKHIEAAGDVVTNLRAFAALLETQLPAIKAIAEVEPPK